MLSIQDQIQALYISSQHVKVFKKNINRRNFKVQYQFPWNLQISFSILFLIFFFWKNDDLFAYIDLLNTNLLMTPKALVVVDINIITTENFEIQYTLLINYL